MITVTDFTELEAITEYLRNVPFDVTRRRLYNATDLYAGYYPNDEKSFDCCYDSVVYKYYMEKGAHAKDPRETLSRSLHDHNISRALDEFLKERDPMLSVGIMGGHSLSRTDGMYRHTAVISKRLTEEGFLMLSGGGPGAMEATHLGAWMAGRTSEELDTALKILQMAPCYKDKGWLYTAFEVMRRFPQTEYCSLGIPTWLYGHEPSTPFATHIAKFFQNCIREDDILTLAYGGIIYTPGSAGTMQEIFQDAVQNHYLSFGVSSPMAFMGKDFWTGQMPVYPLLQDLMASGRYKNLLLSLSDTADEVIAEILKFREERQAGNGKAH